MVLQKNNCVAFADTTGEQLSSTSVVLDISVEGIAGDIGNTQLSWCFLSRGP